MTCEDCKHFITQLPPHWNDYCRIQCKVNLSGSSLWSTPEKYNMADELCPNFEKKFPKFIRKLKEQHYK